MAKSAGKLKPRKQALLVEVGSDWIKIVLAEADGAAVRISKLHLEPVDPDIPVSETIAEALKKQKFPAIPVTACLPRQAVNVRLIELPSTDSSEIADMIDLQVGRQTPYSKEEILCDYKALGTTRQGTYTRVMLAIVQRSVVRARFHDLDAAGRDIGQMSVSSEGISSWFVSRGVAEEKGSATAILDVDSTYSDLIVVQNGSLTFSKSILVGAGHLAGGDSGVREKLTREVERALASCQGETQSIELTSLIVTGAGTRIDGLCNVLGDELGISVSAVDSLGDVRWGKDVAEMDDPRFASASLTSLIGMAMAPDEVEISLVPDAVRMCRDMMWQARSLSMVGILFMAVLVSASLYGILSFKLKQARRDELKQVVAQQEPTVRKVNKMVEVLREARRRMDSRFAPINLMPVIHKQVPKNVFFTTLDLDINRRQLQLAGTAASRKEIRLLVKNLEDTEALVDVEEGGKTTMDKDGRFKFLVICHLEEAK